MNTTTSQMETVNATSDKVLCTDYVDFGQHEHRFGRLSWSKIEKNGDNFLEVQLKCFRRCDGKDFERHQKLAMGEMDFRQLIQNRNRLAIAAAEFAKAQNLTHIKPPLYSRDYETQQTLAHKVVEAVNRSHRKIIITMLRYNVDDPNTAYAQVRLFTRRTLEDTFTQTAFVNYKLDEFVHLLNVIVSVADKVLDNQKLCSVL